MGGERRKVMCKEDICIRQYVGYGGLGGGGCPYMKVEQP